MIFKHCQQVFFLFLLAASLAVFPAADANAQDGKGKSPAMSEKVLNQLKVLGDEKRSRTAAQRKMSSRLVRAVKIRRGDPMLRSLPGLQSFVQVEADNTTLVDIKAAVTPGLLEKIHLLGGTIINSFVEYDAIRARLPLDALETLAEGKDVHNIRPAEKAFLRKTDTSEGDVAHKADVARALPGTPTGSGVRVGVLSDSVDYLAAVQATGDLPSVTVLENAPGNSGEGTAMLEIVHDLAPDSELLFATAWLGRASFASNIQKLAAAGSHVIVDDVGYLEESPFQDDIISQAVNTVTSQGVLYFSSAGNAGNLNDGTSGVWEGDFSGRAETIDGLALEVHDFGGADWANLITSDAGCYTLFWADPLGGSNNDYDLFLIDPTGMTIVGSSEDVQDGTQDPFEGFCVSMDITNYSLFIVNYDTLADDRFLHLSANRGTLEHNTEGQIAGHPAAVDAFAVSAVSAFSLGVPFTGAESVETFTSDGPRRVFFAADGTPETPGNFLSTGGTVRNKPDITAADGVMTATPGFNPFYGTSAAAPHAAAIGALMISRNPAIQLPQVRTAFQTTALDIEAAGWDRDSGWGIVMADTAVTAAGALPASDWTLTVTKDGTGGGTVFSAPAGGLDCGSSCTGSYYDGTMVTLNAVPDNSSTFTGWSGDADCADGQVTSSAPTNVSCTATFTKKFSWTMFRAALTKRNPETYWGALSYVYCSSSAATFSLTSSGVTKKSVCQAGGCAGGAGTFEGWATTTPGSKSFTWSLSSSTCGTWPGGFNYSLVEGKNYLFSLDLNGGTPTVYVSVGTGKPQGASFDMRTLDKTESSTEYSGTWEVIDQIPLDIPKGIFASSRKGITVIGK